jgi:uncharacterized protein (UPF0335 family)
MAKPRTILEVTNNDGFKKDLTPEQMIPEVVEKILASREKADTIKDQLEEEKGRTRSLYTEAKSKGLDTKALKKVVEIKRGKVESDEHKATLNAYLKAMGELPLFASAGAVH